MLWVLLDGKMSYNAGVSHCFLKHLGRVKYSHDGRYRCSTHSLNTPLWMDASSLIGQFNFILIQHTLPERGERKAQSKAQISGKCKCNPSLLYAPPAQKVHSIYVYIVIVSFINCLFTLLYFFISFWFSIYYGYYHLNKFMNVIECVKWKHLLYDGH